ncbi:HPr(Ser) kinase/phosphatase [Feifania hominis]|uniref:HPr kinase/phosphorylase n=1 Tax=Feifania hominis TaxID=2763660 RepID=A0A926DC41_9FIRM|nr:HPr(Ser) kinase/phosphatase [Feifania hominis]MBC8535122.1 HPr(Ser) kinase/phosphatase [Feifania hominis]
MAKRYNVLLEDFIREFSLETIHMPEGGEKNRIYSPDVNRPGLQLVGFFDYFDNERLQVLGNVETSFLSGLSSDQITQSADLLFSKKVPAVIIARELDVMPELLEAAVKYGVPLLRTKDSTSFFISAAVAFLNLHLAPRITRHGVLVEVFGEGVLLLGESGVGKSETAVELIKRGHRLIADDAVEIKRVSAKSLVGTAPENIRHFIELRGIGVVDVRRLFGMGAIKLSEKIDLVIQLEIWNEKKAYDRLGMDNEMIDILGIEVPVLTIPVRPGRNLALVIEVAAMNNRQKKMGYNAAKELNDRLIKSMMEQKREEEEN